MNTKAKKKFEEMSSWDMKPVSVLMLREKWVSNEAEAKEGVHGLLQWLAGHAVVNHQRPYVMMHGVVDKAWHAFMLNSKSYQSFCGKHIGFFIHHTPMDGESANKYVILGGIDYTTEFLSDMFGGSLNSHLATWKNAENRIISAVSCVGNGYDDVSKEDAPPTEKADYWQTFKRA